MRRLVSAMLILVGVIHLLPVSGVLGGETLAALYGISVSDQNLALLMRHRAVLFGLLGAFLVAAAFKPAWQAAALAAGFVSVMSFLVLAWPAGNYSPEIERVFKADIAALICLMVAAAARRACKT